MQSKTAADLHKSYVLTRYTMCSMLDIYQNALHTCLQHCSPTENLFFSAASILKTVPPTSAAVLQVGNYIGVFSLLHAQKNNGV